MLTDAVAIVDTAFNLNPGFSGIWAIYAFFAGIWSASLILAVEGLASHT
jgi:hypothetical protein